MLWMCKMYAGLGLERRQLTAATQSSAGFAESFARPGGNMTGMTLIAPVTLSGDH